MSRTGPAKAEPPPVEAGGPTPKTTEEGELRAQVGDDTAPSQASGSGGGRRSKLLIDKLGGQEEYSHDLKGGKSSEGKGEKRNGQQAELEHPQTLGGGKKIKGPEGFNIKLQELSPKRNGSKQIRKVSTVGERSKVNQANRGVALGEPNNKEDTSKAWKLKLWPRQTTAKRRGKEQVSVQGKVFDPRLSAVKLKPWDGLTVSLKSEEIPALIREERKLPDEKVSLEVRERARASPPVQE